MNRHLAQLLERWDDLRMSLPRGSARRARIKKAMYALMYGASVRRTRLTMQDDINREK